MTIKVRIHDRPDVDGIGLYVLLIGGPDHDRWLHVMNPAGEWEERAQGAFYNDIPPTIFLPQDIGRAVLDALVSHYQGAEDTRALRKDYDAERARVDKMLGALIAVAVPGISSS